MMTKLIVIGSLLHIGPIQISFPEQELRTYIFPMFQVELKASSNSFESDLLTARVFISLFTSMYLRVYLFFGFPREFQSNEVL